MTGRFARPRITRTLIQVVVALAIVASLGPGCSNGSSDGNASTVSPTAGSDNGSSSVLRRALQAVIDGDKTGYLDEVRPDRRNSDPYRGGRPPDSILTSTRELAGCSLDGAQVLVEQRSSPSEMDGTIVFASPCGNLGAVAKPITHCALVLVFLGERWYVGSGNPPYSFAD